MPTDLSLLIQSAHTVIPFRQRQSGRRILPANLVSKRHIRGYRFSRVSMRAGQPDVVTDWIEKNLDGGKVVRVGFVGSSSWSSAYKYDTEGGPSYFIKTALGQDEGMFQGEALGLQAMYETHTLRIPKVFHYGSLSTVPAGRGLGGGGSFIVMECLNLGGRARQDELGRGLALMHSAPPSDENAKAGKFGFAVDNTIGGTPQPNGWMDNWVDFFRERRLLHQLRLAGDPQLTELGRRLADNLEVFFEGVQVKPCLLHGDLWSGNMTGVAEGGWAILDPATYYGHSEAEFGMSWCAGFDRKFWDAYFEVLPPAPGFEERKPLYLLYHYLNHYNLFGSSYYGQCVSLLKTLTKRL